MCLCKKSLSFLSPSFLSPLEGCCNVSPEPGSQPQPSACLHRRGASSPFIIFVALLWTYSNRSMSFLCWGPQNWVQHSRWGLTRAEQRDSIPSFPLLAVLLLMQPRMQLASGLQVHNASSFPGFCPPIFRCFHQTAIGCGRRKIFGSAICFIFCFTSCVLQDKSWQFLKSELYVLYRCQCPNLTQK